MLRAHVIRGYTLVGNSLITGELEVAQNMYDSASSAMVRGESIITIVNATTGRSCSYVMTLVIDRQDRPMFDYKRW
jgi:hypothetical protein